MRLMPAPTHAPARPPDAYRVLAGRSRQALLGALLRAPRPMDATEAGRAVGLHRNTARVQLDVLRSAGLVRRFPEERASRGRPRMLYEAATTAADLLGAAERAASEAGDRAGYRDLARLLAAQLAERSDAAAAAVRAGRRWAAALDEHPLPAGPLPPGRAAEALAGVLARLGFAPEPDRSGSQILLHRCPFADVARESRAVVCGIHLGMLKATAERLDSPLQIEGLDPFVVEEPSLCVVRLAGADGGRR